MTRLYRGILPQKEYELQCKADVSAGHCKLQWSASVQWQETGAPDNDTLGYGLKGSQGAVDHPVCQPLRDSTRVLTLAIKVVKQSTTTETVTGA